MGMKLRAFMKPLKYQSTVRLRCLRELSLGLQVYRKTPAEIKITAEVFFSGVGEEIIYEQDNFLRQGRYPQIYICYVFFLPACVQDNKQNISCIFFFRIPALSWKNKSWVCFFINPLRPISSFLHVFKPN